jgi:hypothetical protein
MPPTPKAKAVEVPLVIRRPGAEKGQGETQAISQRGWEYEHDETDEQIAAIENMIDTIRLEEGVVMGDSYNKRGVVFSWSRQEDGSILIGTTYKGDDDLWISETWEIAPDGTVT